MIFLSHTHHDLAEAREVAQALANRGQNVWVDDMQIAVGEQFVGDIGIALRRSRIFVLLESNASLQSYWVRREVAAAKRLEMAGVIHQSVSLTLDAGWHDSAFPYRVAFRGGESAAEAICGLMKECAHRAGAADSHRVDSVRLTTFGRGESTIEQSPNWLGYSGLLSRLDHWWDSGRFGVWLHGRRGTGKTALVRTWIAALVELGYARPLSGSVLLVSGSPDLCDTANRKRIVEGGITCDGGDRLVVIDDFHFIGSQWLDLINDLRSTGTRVALVTASRSEIGFEAAMVDYLRESATLFAEIEVENLTPEDLKILLIRSGVDAERADSVIRLLRPNEGLSHLVPLIEKLGVILRDP